MVCLLISAFRRIHLLHEQDSTMILSTHCACENAQMNKMLIGQEDNKENLFVSVCHSGTKDPAGVA